MTSLLNGPARTRVAASRARSLAGDAVPGADALADEVPHVVAHRVGVPLGVVEQPLDTARTQLPDLLDHRQALLPLRGGGAGSGRWSAGAPGTAAGTAVTVAEAVSVQWSLPAGWGG